jgi:hypothetical protein
MSLGSECSQASVGPWTNAALQAPGDPVARRASMIAIGYRRVLRKDPSFSQALVRLRFSWA